MYSIIFFFFYCYVTLCFHPIFYTFLQYFYYNNNIHHVTIDQI